MIGGATPSAWNFGANWPCWNENADFQSIFARSVTPSEQSLVNNNRKSTTRFPILLRWTSPKGAQKRKTAVFRLKLHVTWRKSATKLLCVNTVNDKVVRHSLAVQKWFPGNVPYYVKISPKLTNPFKNADFQSIFARSASAVTLSERSSVKTNIGNPLRAYQWASDEQCTLPISPPPKGAWKRNVQNFNNNCDNFRTVYEIECRLLITNTKSHTDFLLVPISVTLNDLERRNSPYFAFFHRFR